MKVLDPGHVYDLDWLDDDEDFDDHLLVFVKREGPGYPGNIGHHPGTNLQEVLRALIDRVKYLNGQIYNECNDEIIADLRNSIWRLECRAAERHGRFANFVAAFDPAFIETYSTCVKCKHVGCGGNCHP